MPEDLNWAIGGEVYVLGDDEGVHDAVAESYDGQQVFAYGFADFLDLATVAVKATGGSAEDAKVENFG